METRTFVTDALDVDFHDLSVEEQLVVMQLARAEYNFRSVNGIVEEVEANGLDASHVSRILSELVQHGVARVTPSSKFGFVYGLVSRVGTR